MELDLYTWNLQCECFVHVQMNSTLSQLCARFSISISQCVFSLAAKIATHTFYGSMHLVDKAVNFHVKLCHLTVKLCRFDFFLS